MNKNESKYFNTAVKMDEALISLLEKKEFAYITVKEICEKAGVNPFHNVNPMKSKEVYINFTDKSQRFYANMIVDFTLLL